MASSYHQSTDFTYNPDSNMMNHDDPESEFSGILDICIHHARNIHNICIYDNQDVYAKFSLTYNPDEAISTRIVNGGGKNPDFDQNLEIKVTQRDAVLKCEIWMLSRARHYMEDQLLGFSLVPISTILGKGKIVRDYSLTSTDLFHSPAGIIKLSLSLSVNKNLHIESDSNSSISSEVVLLLDRKIPEEIDDLDRADSVKYSRIEFPDINVVTKNQQMVSEYIEGPNPSKFVSFLRLGTSSPNNPDDYDMASEENISISPNSEILSSTTTATSLNSADSNQGACNCPVVKSEKVEDQESSNEEATIRPVELGQAFSAPLGNIQNETEQSAMQQQIVDMYMKSMQQFTESLEKMKIPKPKNEELIQNRSSGNNNSEIEKKKEDGSRVFYGSRAFF